MQELKQINSGRERILVKVCTDNIMPFLERKKKGFDPRYIGYQLPTLPYCGQYTKFFNLPIHQMIPLTSIKITPWIQKKTGSSRHQFLRGSLVNLFGIFATLKNVPSFGTQLRYNIEYTCMEYLELGSLTFLYTEISFLEHKLA